MPLGQEGRGSATQAATDTSNDDTSLHAVKRQPLPLNPPSSWWNVARPTAPPASSTEHTQSRSQTSSAHRQTSSRNAVRLRSPKKPSQVTKKKLLNFTTIHQVCSVIFRFRCKQSHFLLQHKRHHKPSIHKSYHKRNCTACRRCCWQIQHYLQLEKCTLLYVTPTPNSYVSDTGFNEFSEALNSVLTSNQISTSSLWNAWYKDVIHLCTSDQLHCTFEAGRWMLPKY